MSRQSGFLLVAAGVLVFTLYSLLPPAQAVSFGSMGSQVAVGNSDLRPTLYQISTAYVARVEKGSSGFTDDNFYVFWNDASGKSQVQNGAVRIAPISGGFSFGTFAVSGNSDLTDTWTNPGGSAVPLSSDFIGNVKYMEMDGKIGYSEGDVVYWDAPSSITGCGSNGALSICDVRLSTVSVNGTSYTAGTIVKSGETDVTEAGDSDGFYPDGTTLSGTFTLWYFDANGNYEVDSGDYLYLRESSAPSQAGARIPIVGDVRLSAAGSNSAGSKVAKDGSDWVPTLKSLSSIDCVANVKDGETNVANYKLFLVWDPDGTCGGVPSRVALNDIQIVGSGLTTGSLVTTTSAGYGKTIDDKAAFASNIFYVDANSNGYYDSGDPVYWNRPSTGAWGGDSTSNKLTAHDLRLTSVSVSGTSYSAGTIVASGNTDLTAYTGLTGTAGFTLKFFDGDYTQATTLQSLTNPKVTGSDALWDSTSEFVYLSSSSTVTAGDTVVFHSTCSAGTVVTADNCGQGTAIRTLNNARVTGPDSSWTSSTEYIYISVDTYINAPDKRVTAVTAPSASTYSASPTTSVANTDDDVDTQTAITLSSADQIYVGRGAVGTISLPQQFDLKLVGSWTRLTSASTADFIPSLTSPTATTIVAARWDKAQSSNFFDDVFYISQATSTDSNPKSGDVRLIALDSSKTAGSQVTSGDADATQTITRGCTASGLAACVGFIDVTGPSKLGAGDIIWLETNSFSGSPGASGFSQLDIRLNTYTLSATSFSAGTLVRIDESDRTTHGGTALAAPSCREAVMKYWDDDGSGTFNTGDTMYVTFDTTAGSGCPGAFTSLIPHVFDVRATGTTSTTATTTTTTTTATTTTTTGTTTSTTTKTTTATTTATTTTSAAEETETTGPEKTTTTSVPAPTPGPGLALVVVGAVLALGVLLMRRDE